MPVADSDYNATYALTDVFDANVSADSGGPEGVGQYGPGPVSVWD